MKKLLLLFLLWSMFVPMLSQRTVIYDDGIASLRLDKGSEVSGLPVLDLSKREELTVSFDDLTHEYRRFSYRIEHVGADFLTDEGLFDSEYMIADDAELLIEDYAQSMNTTVLYNHYSFKLPNVNMRPLLSGNYRLTVRVEDEDGNMQPAFETYFAVVEHKTSVLLRGTTNTEIDYNKTHQQLDIELTYGDELFIRDATQDIRIVVLQNGRWDNAVEYPKPTAQTGKSLKWEHSRDLIFKAGNEYRKFEQLSTRVPGMFVDNVRYFEPYYYATLPVNTPRKNYLYDEDQNGRYVIRTERSGDADVEADYMWVMFQLEMPQVTDADVYLDGLWTGNLFVPRYQMKYNAQAGRYEALIFLKQGYYSYQYVAVRRGGGGRKSAFSVEGDFFQTENEYTVLVYYRKPGDRYDQLVGWRTASYRAR